MKFIKGVFDRFRNRSNADQQKKAEEEKARGNIKNQLAQMAGFLNAVMTPGSTILFDIKAAKIIRLGQGKAPKGGIIVISKPVAFEVMPVTMTPEAN